MPIVRNSFYTRDDTIDLQEESARSNKDNDFYKGVEITKVASAPSKVVVKKPEEESKAESDPISITIQGLSKDDKDKLLKINKEKDKDKDKDKKLIEKEA